uniref:hypothetical protein n=1 Tax=Komagataeibacter oboediens TaxID=65958 RepID=UPI0038D12767
MKEFFARAISFRALKSKIGQPRMIVGASSRRPMEQSVSGLYRQVIDRCDPAAHKPGGIEFHSSLP